MPPREQDNWSEWREHVLAELRELKSDNKEIRDGLVNLKVDVSALKVKAGMWGGLAGLLPLLVEKVLKI